MKKTKINRLAAKHARACYARKRAKNLTRLACWVAPENLIVFSRLQNLPWDQPMAKNISAAEWLAIFATPERISEPLAKNLPSAAPKAASSASDSKVADQTQFHF